MTPTNPTIAVNPAELTTLDILLWINNFTQQIEQDYLLLDNLDMDLGDGDHGQNLKRALLVAKKRLNQGEIADVSYIFDILSFSISVYMGGKGGRAYAMLFLTCGQLTEHKTSINIVTLMRVLNQASNTVCQAFNLAVGDKTFIDVLLPVSKEMQLYLQQNHTNPYAHLAEISKKYCTHTIKIPTQKDSTCQTNKNALGYQDPGATSVMLLLETLGAVVGDSTIESHQLNNINPTSITAINH